MQVDPKQIKKFRKTVWAFYIRQGRHDLPWRQDTSPYSILISEVMLQQTQVSRVVVKYAEFMARFPSLEALAKATPFDVLAVWQGLGYNRRGLWLHQTARLVQGKYNGELPADPAELVKLPGIGPNTAGSIAAFAFNAPVVFIETNIRRVFIHHFFDDSSDVPDTELRPFIEASLETSRPREWYWALMDYGSGLAKTVPNPNRRSRHYTKQSQFAGSDRQLRGEIVRQLLAKGPATELELAKQTKEPAERTRKVLAGLVRDGLIELQEGKVRVIER